MNVSSLLLGSVVAVIVASVAGCQASVSVQTKARYEEKNVQKEDSADWAGGKVEILIEGVGLAVNGGVKVTADPNATKVRAVARILAMALDTEEEKRNADRSIAEAKETFTITSDGQSVSVKCGHGGKHGTSEAGESGCEFVEVIVPAGKEGQALDLDKVLSGNGTMTLALSSATLSHLGVNANGDINAELPATKGGVYALVTEEADDIAVKLPSDFAADEVILQADDIALGPFQDIKQGAGAGGRGAPGTGLASLKITSKEFAGGTGMITLQ